MRRLDPDRDIRIDKFALDEELEVISELIYRYDKLWNNVIFEVKVLSNQLIRLEEELKEFKAETAFNVKKEWDLYDFKTKPTDKEAENYVYSTQGYKDKISEIVTKRKELAKAESREHKYKNFHFALLTKRDSLSELIKLYLSNYFAKPENYSGKYAEEDYKENEMREKMSKMDEIVNNSIKERGVINDD